MTMNLILPHINQMKPYASGAQPHNASRAVKLNLNECLYPPSPHVLEVLRTVDGESLQRYPDRLCYELREALSIHYNVSLEQTFCGNGSSEIITLLFHVFIGSQHRIAVPDPSFPLYYTVASIHQVECIKVPTRDDFSIDVDLLLASGAQAVILVNPNAPTGKVLPLSEVERLVSQFDGLVVVDEAYIDFAETGQSAIPLINRYSNLIVIRTFSKAYSLCGARVGYCFSNEALIAALEKGRNLFNVNAISQKLALAALQDQEYLKRTVTAARRIRDTFSAKLQNIGFNVIPSQTNFILCSPPSNSRGDEALRLYEELMRKNIYVRYFDSDRLRDYLRISVGAENEMAILFDAICEWLGLETLARNGVV